MQATLSEGERKELWKQVSGLERRAVGLLAGGDEAAQQQAFRLLAESLALKGRDPFVSLCAAYQAALARSDESEARRLLGELPAAGLPPHLLSLSQAVAAHTAHAV
ncbi:hypothetical protein EON64_17520, partial [archaeon]